MFGTIFKHALENKLYKQHIADCAACDGKKHLPFPTVEQDDEGECKQFGDGVAACKDTYVFQAVNDQHAKDRCREHFSEVPYVCRCGLSGREKKEGQESCEDGAEDYHADGDKLLG